MSFADCLTIILGHEGGFVNDPKDPGGMTNLGVTRRTWEEWTKTPASESVMRNLTRVAVAPLYKAQYWDAVKGDHLVAGLDLCLFDFAVNAGPNRAARLLQALVGADDDGKIGPATLAAVQAFIARKGLAALILRYQGARRGYYFSLSTFDRFGRGWLRRTDETEELALGMGK
ncbi:glycoside hydrolase family 108 protein [Novosphingobium olei]|uniref:glycoside hydrolase family 108 protein n=1 Tax=Novosphingobium olei TaxID=2728851 RepID=UPI0030910E4B|nr:glycoside hydrolase family 108 protein [Novosphingobium olei]